MPGRSGMRTYSPSHSSAPPALSKKRKGRTTKTSKRTMRSFDMTLPSFVDELNRAGVTGTGLLVDELAGSVGEPSGARKVKLVELVAVCALGARSFVSAPSET